jgi:hypothetical protein
MQFVLRVEPTAEWCAELIAFPLCTRTLFELHGGTRIQNALYSMGNHRSVNIRYARTKHPNTVSVDTKKLPQIHSIHDIDHIQHPLHTHSLTHSLTNPTRALTYCHRPRGSEQCSCTLVHAHRRGTRTRSGSTPEWEKPHRSSNATSAQKEARERERK